MATRLSKAPSRSYEPLARRLRKGVNDLLAGKHSLWVIERSEAPAAAADVASPPLSGMAGKHLGIEPGSLRGALYDQFDRLVAKAEAALPT